MATEDGVDAKGSEDAGEEPRPPKAKPAAQKKRGGLATGLIALALLLVVGGGVGLYLYGFSSVGKSRSVAHEHLPASCDVVARADIAKIQALPAFQAKVKPALDELTADAATFEDPDLADLKSFLLEARLDPARDVEEVALCVIDPANGGKFALVVGGTFSPGGVVEAAAKRGEQSEKIEIAGRPAVKGKSRKSSQVVYFGQAEDGAIVLSNDQGLVAEAFKKSDAHTAVYKLPLASEASAVVTSGLLSKQAERIRANPFVRGLAPVKAASGSIGLATPGAQARLVTGSAADAANVQREIEGIVSLAKLKSTFLGGGGKQGLVDTLLAVKASVDGSDVVLDVPWSAQGVDDLMTVVADGMRKAKKK